MLAEQLKKAEGEDAQMPAWPIAFEETERQQNMQKEESYFYFC